MADTKPRNLMTFGIISVMLQIFLAIIISLAQTNSFYDYTAQTDSLDGQINKLTGSVGEFKIYNGTKEDIDKQGSSGIILDMWQWGVNTIGAVAKLAALGVTVFSSYAMIWSYPGTYVGGVMGGLLNIMLIIWQVATSSMILKVITPRFN